ncbi:MAG: hypothetical protein QF721_06190 [Verrucomicrobiota bacterium]|jgi:hypothetical protein|nr:hypothetical protein [Verrucomicrobiota bacterium]
MNATAGLVLAILIFGAAMFMLGQIIPGILVLTKVLAVFLVVVLGIVVPVQAASLKLAIRAIFREDVPFKASYVLMAILLIVYVVIMMVAFNTPIMAYAGQFIVGSFLLGKFVEMDGESIGILKGALVSLLTTAITYGIWFVAGTTIMGMLR